MSKIVQAANAMICNPEKISSVIQNGSEIFFLYNDKYKWSMTKNIEGSYRLFFYPGDETLAQLACAEEYEWERINMVVYIDSEIGTREAKDTFAELYTLLKECVYGVHTVLNDIISDVNNRI